jgi:WD40 repeat protein
MRSKEDAMSRQKSVAAVVAAFCAAATIVMSSGSGQVNAMAEGLTVQQVKTIDAPRVFHPGVEDKPGYWEDFGLTTAFDFNPTTGMLVAVVAKINGPTRLLVFNLEQGTIQGTIPSQPIISTNIHARIRAVRLSPDGTIAAVPTGADREIALWNVMSRTLIGKAQVDGNAVDVDWNSSGDSVVVVAGKTIEIWTVAGGLARKGTVRIAPDNWPLSVRWSPDGRYLAIGTNVPSVLIAKADGSMVTGLGQPLGQPFPKGSVEQLEWNASGDRLAAAGSEISIWKDPKMAIDSLVERKYELVRTFTPPAGGWLGRLTWDPSGRLVAFGDSASNVAIFDPSSTTALKSFVAHPGSQVLETHWKGDYLITVGAFPDKSFRIWRVTR